MAKAETPTTAGHIYPSADVYWRAVESKGASCSHSVLWGHHYVPEPSGGCWKCGPSLMGRDWLYKLKPNLGIFHTSTHVGMDNHIQKLLSRHSELFKDELGLVKRVTVKLYVDPSAYLGKNAPTWKKCPLPSITQLYFYRNVPRTF